MLKGHIEASWIFGFGRASHQSSAASHLSVVLVHQWSTRATRSRTSARDQPISMCSNILSLTPMDHNIHIYINDRELCKLAEYRGIFCHITYLSTVTADVELSLWITLCVRHMLISRASTTTKKQHMCPRSIPSSFRAGGIAAESSKGRRAAAGWFARQVWLHWPSRGHVVANGARRELGLGIGVPNLRHAPPMWARTGRSCWFDNLRWVHCHQSSWLRGSRILWRMEVNVFENKGLPTHLYIGTT